MTSASIAIQASGSNDVLDEIEFARLIQQAADLVNPKSGIANDYLNTFNEILLLIENLPVLLPEMVDEMVEWRPRNYREYFEASNLPGSKTALQIYNALEPRVRTHFETMIAAVNEIALESVATIKEHRNEDGEINPDEVADFCERTSLDMRRQLELVSDFVNNGYMPANESAQMMADRILSTAN